MMEEVLSRDIFVRGIKGSPQTNRRVAEAMEWFSRIREDSHFDADVLKYPQTALLQAYVKETGEPILYMPVQHVLMLEALGPSPNASPIDIAKGLAEIIKIVNYDAQGAGIGEVYYPSTDENVNKFAQAHHFDLMDYEVPCALSEQNPQGIETRLIPFFKLKTYKP